MMVVIDDPRTWVAYDDPLDEGIGLENILLIVVTSPCLIGVGSTSAERFLGKEAEPS